MVIWLVMKMTDLVTQSKGKHMVLQRNIPCADQANCERAKTTREHRCANSNILDKPVYCTCCYECYKHCLNKGN